MRRVNNTSNYIVNAVANNIINTNTNSVETCRLCRQNDANLISFEGLPVCFRCAVDLPSCLFCGRTIVFGYYRIEDRYGNALCYECSRLYRRCPVCGRFIHKDHVVFDGLEYVCPECCSTIEQFEEDDHGDYIHNYGYKPKPKFYGHHQKDLLFGIELEVDRGGEDNRKAKGLLQIVNGDDDEKFIYVKHDGSLTDGFEIVSHPASLHHHLNTIPWKEAFEYLKSNGYESEDTSTCGLHVHINRLFLGRTYKTIVNVESRILFFFEHFWDYIVKFSRRTEYEISRWCYRYHTTDYEEALYCNQENRYYALNFQNKATIEIRIFKGTLDYNVFEATLRFIDNVVRYCKKYGIRTIEKRGWNGFLNFIVERSIKDHINLANYMIKQGIW